MSSDRWLRAEHWQDPFGHARDLGEVWALRKAAHTARCVLQGHPIGIEARILIDGQVQRTEAFRDSQAMIDATWEWRRAFEGNGWRS